MSDPTSTDGDLLRRPKSVDVVARFSTESPPRFRYAVSCITDIASSEPLPLVIGLYPSSQENVRHDPAIRPLVRLLPGGFELMTLFGARVSHPSDFCRLLEPIGPETVKWLRVALSRAETVIAAWGDAGGEPGCEFIPGRVTALQRLLPAHKRVLCWGMGDTGQPLAPEDVKPGAVLVPWERK